MIAYFIAGESELITHSNSRVNLALPSYDFTAFYFKG